jgi:hypothetical protein
MERNCEDCVLFGEDECAPNYNISNLCLIDCPYFDNNSLDEINYKSINGEYFWDEMSYYLYVENLLDYDEENLED